MKKLFFTAAIAVLGFTNVDAQEDASGATSKGSILVEANTGNAMVGQTGIYFASSDGSSEYSIGLDGGYFIMDDLAVKVGLGYAGFSPDEGDSSSALSYRIGAKYYFNSMIPVTVDLTGASGDGAENFLGETPLWLGLGAGYAWFISDSISIEPGLRYNLSLNEDFTDQGVFQFNVGFALYF